MVVVKRQRREKPAKIEQRTSEDRSEDLRYNKQHSWLAWLAQFTYGRPRGRRKHIKRGAKGPGVCLSAGPGQTAALEVVWVIRNMAGNVGPTWFFSSCGGILELLFCFRGLFPSLSFSHPHFGLLFPILTT